MPPLSLQELAQQLDGRIDGDAALVVEDVAALHNATAREITYLETRKQLSALLKSQAGAVLTSAELSSVARDRGCQIPLVLVADPQAAFITTMLIFRPLPARSEIGASEDARISPSAEIGLECNIHPGASVGENVRIGTRCDIGPGVVIGDDCVIGDGCQLHPNAVIYPGAQLGNRVIIHANAVIGADGFGYRFAQGRFEKIPHTGTVIIEDDVEIGACTTVDRGMIGATVIGQGTKLDNQVMIAHNCRIGRHNAFASQVGLAGSVTTGDYVQCGGQVGVADHVLIGSQTKLGAKAGVVWDVPDGQVCHGIPAIPEKDAIRNHLMIQKLPEMREQVKQLLARIEQLEAASVPALKTDTTRSAA